MLSQFSRQRRRLLAAGLGLAAAPASAAVWWPEQGLLNPCRGALPPHLANHELVQAAWAGLDPAKVWDCHAHLIGIGDSGSGIWINPRMRSLLHPVEYAQRFFYLNAGCARNPPGSVDVNYVERIRKLVDDMRAGFKLILLAFDHSYDVQGSINLPGSAFFTPNPYARDVARNAPGSFEWAASIHPYRADCVMALEEARRGGAVAVKWLPAAMGIDPASPRCDPFYAALTQTGLPLITHAGMERALATGEQGFGNPLRLRRALEHGVRVVVAHCASLGEDRDTDCGPNGPYVPSFALFARLMDDPRYDGRLFGDLSAMTQSNRAGPPLATIVERSEWHPRLVNGSDYPLPGVMPLYSVAQFVHQRWIEASAAPVLTEIRGHNPLLFDFVLKRHLAVNGRRLPAAVFETRGFFRR
jgi:predicted TIM-barrel fold metal-dependent hydrolase